MAAAEPSQAPYPVCEIYLTYNLTFFYIKPTDEGRHRFGGEGRIVNVGDINSKVEIEANLIYNGRKHWDRFEKPKQPKQREESANAFGGITNEVNYKTPALSNGEYYIYVVYSNHPTIGMILDEYSNGLASCGSYQEDAIAFTKTAHEYTIEYRSKEGKPTGAGMDARQPRSQTVLNRVKALAREAGTAAGTAAGEGGSRRRRRPSRKYKKSKRVMRRKSRSTRRR